MLNPDDLQQFEEAFDTNGCGSVRHCYCGRIFWDAADGGWDWEDGEEDRLRANPDATAVGHACGSIWVEGREYAMDCTCWHERAGRIVEFLRDNQRNIGRWYALEQKRLVAAAAAVPKVNPPAAN